MKTYTCSNQIKLNFSNLINCLQKNVFIFRNTDMMIGGLGETELTRKKLSSSIPYYTDDLTWCIAKAGLAPTWLNVFKIFDVSTWIVVAVMLLLTTIILHRFKKSDKNNENLGWSFLITLSMTISTPGHYKPNKFFIKIFFMTLAIYGMNFGAAYHSILISVLTSPRYDKQISSLDEIINNNFKISGGHHILTYFKENDEVGF